MVAMAEQSCLYLIVGDEEFLIARAVEQVIAEVRARHPEPEVRDFNAAQGGAGELAELLSPTLFGGVSLVVVRDAHAAGADLAAALLASAESADDDLLLVFTHAGGARGKTLLAGLRQAGATVINAPRLTKYRDLVEFIRDEITRRGGRCRPGAAEELLEVVGRHPRELASACRQLVHDTGGEVTPDLVRRYHQGRADVTGFSVADAVLVGDVPRALEMLRWALAAGVDPVPLADALADGVRTIARVSGLRRGHPGQLAAETGMPPWKVEKAQQQAHGWTPAGLTSALQEVAALNAEVKGGSDDRHYALERTILALAAARG
jgi:DNA polymerase-3 subunit delta